MFSAFTALPPMFNFYSIYAINSPSGIPIVFKDSKTAFYENSVWREERNSLITLNEKDFFSS
jgi:hypothetical protein